MDILSLGGKFLGSITSAKKLDLLDRPQIPERAAAAAAVARVLAGLPPHQRLSLPSTSAGTPLVYNGWQRREKPEDLEAVFFEQGFDPVRHLLDKLNNQDVDAKYFEAQVAQKEVQLNDVTEKLSNKVMEHHEEMVKGMQLVMELEKDLQVATIICKNGKRCLSSSMHEVSQDLVVTSNVNKKQVLMDILPILVKIQHAMDIKSRLESLVREGNYAKALQMCSLCLQLMEECSGVTAVLDVHNNIDEWLQRTMLKVEAVLLETCHKFDADNFITVIDAYSMIDDNALGEKIQNIFVQIIVSETHAVLRDLLYEETKGLSSMDRKMSLLSNGTHKRSGSLGSLPVAGSLSKHGGALPLSVSGSPSRFSAGKAEMRIENSEILVDLLIDRKRDNQTSCNLMSNTNHKEEKELCVLDSQDLEEDMKGVIVSGSLNRVTERMRRETIMSVSKTLEKGRKHVWELSARRVSTLLSVDSECATSPHHFLQSLDLINTFVLAGEAFSGLEAISLRAKLTKLSEKYFGTLHRQNLEVLRMMLENEPWQQLSLDAIRTVSLAGLMGDGAPVLVSARQASNMAERVTNQARNGLVGDSKVSEDLRAGFGLWVERGNPFSEKKHHMPLIPRGSNSQPLEAVRTNGIVNGYHHERVQNGNSKAQSEQNNDKDEEEDEDLLADFIDEDSQLPSRVYSSFKSVSYGTTTATGKICNEDLIITGSAVSILRYMDKYARLMQNLQAISSEVFKLKSAFAIAATTRLRTTLVRISQGLEDQHSKASNGNLQGGTNGHYPLESSQIISLQGSSSLSLSPPNLFGLQERCIAVESIAALAEILKKSKARLQSILPQDSLASLENFLSCTVEAVPDLREHIYKTVARLLLNIGSYVDRITTVRWELKELGMEHNGYVNLLLGEFKHFSTRLAQAGISKENQELLLEYGVDILAEVILEGISRVKKCTNEGRALMSLDLQVLINGLRQVAPQRLASNLQIVETYIKAFYLPETEYLSWVRSHPEYSKVQLISLINLVAAMNNWKRKSRTELVEKIEASEF